MAIVLGIDAAWTVTQPSGIALLRSRGGDVSSVSSRNAPTWDCLAIAPSYASFLARTVNWGARPVGGPPDCAALHAACIAIAGAPPDVIAIDMPLATRPITARRAADNAIASAYATRGLGAHSPSPERPGPLADVMRLEFGRLGYRVAGTTTAPATPGVLIEVFPHASAITLIAADYRVPYKLGRVTQYWPEHSAVARRRALLAQWTKLRRALAGSIDGGTLRVPRVGPLAQLKRFEDALDALLCAWTATEYLAGRLRAHGDASAAVWAH
jgi:predicted RNase H-like nuclease